MDLAARSTATSLRRAGCVLLSALLYAAAFPPFGWWVAGFVALVPLLAVLVRCRPFAAFAWGWLWSLLVGFASSPWLPRMVTDYFGASAMGGWIGAVFAIVTTGIFYGVFGAWLAWLAHRRAPAPLELALLWGACEYARTLGPLGNPWVMSGYGQVSFAQLTQIADVGGVVLVGMIVAAVNAALAGLVDLRWRTKHPMRTRVATALVFAAVLGYGQWRLAMRIDEGEQIPVALVQSAIAREHRWQSSSREQNLAQHLDLVIRAGRDRPDLILLSELAIDVPFDDRSAEARSLMRVARESGADLLVGAPSVVDLLVQRRIFNSYVLLRGEGIVERYDKVALAPFSETRPLGTWVEYEGDVYTPGPGRVPLATRAGPVGVLLCSEAMFGSAARDTVLRGAEILANPANDSWFANAAAARMQLDVASLRAIETRRWLLRPTLTGVTAVVDPHGRVASEARFGVPDILRATVHRSRATSPYLRWGDLVAKGAVLAMLAASLGLAVASRRRASAPQ